MPSTNARVMVMFDNGKTMTGPDPNPIAAAAGTAGVIIYSVGLPESRGVDTAALENYTVSSCFRITSVFMPTKGKTSLLDANTVQRQIDELGVPQSEGAVL